MRILGIETSCDETAIALIERNGDEIQILSHALHSQIDIHKQYGGVFPAIAKREHGKNLVPLFLKIANECDFKSHEIGIIQPKLQEKIEKILEREGELQKLFLEQTTKFEKPDIDAIAVTLGPGLEPALWVGINFAKALSTLWDIPLIPINHMEGHIFAALLKRNKQIASLTITSPKTPAVALLVSGGHTELIEVKNLGDYQIVGRTKDDAVGEAFDKVARILGLPYPGGPEISKLAKAGRSLNLSDLPLLPRPMIGSDDLDFSFSGLKTAVLYLTKKIGALNEENKMKISVAFEEAVTEVLVKKAFDAIEKIGGESLIVSGGVIANENLRTALTSKAKEFGIKVLMPTLELSTDNAVMIAIAGSYKESIEILTDLKALGNWKIDQNIIHSHERPRNAG